MRKRSETVRIDGPSIVAILGLVAGLPASECAFSSNELPKIQFRLESLSQRETMTFFSGASYAFEYSRQIDMHLGRQSFYCMPNSKIVSSDLLIEMINERKPGTISAERAAEIMVTSLAARYPCKAE